MRQAERVRAVAARPGRVRIVVRSLSFPFIPFPSRRRRAARRRNRPSPEAERHGVSFPFLPFRGSSAGAADARRPPRGGEPSRYLHGVQQRSPPWRGDLHVGDYVPGCNVVGQRSVCGDEGGFDRSGYPERVFGARLPTLCLRKAAVPMIPVRPLALFLDGRRDFVTAFRNQSSLKSSE